MISGEGREEVLANQDEIVWRQRLNVHLVNVHERPWQTFPPATLIQDSGRQKYESLHAFRKSAQVPE